MYSWQVLYDEIFEPPEFEREPINEEDEETVENEGEEEEEEDIKRTDEDESSKVTSSKKATSSTSNISGSSIRKKFDIIGTVFDQKVHTYKFQNKFRVLLTTACLGTIDNAVTWPWEIDLS